MKLVNSVVLKTGLSLVILGSALTANADPKKEVIEHQQQTNSIEMDAAQKPNLRLKVDLLPLLKRH